MKKNNFFNWRFFVIIITIFFISFAIVWKLFDIQVTDKEFLENEGEKKYVTYKNIKPIRGTIYDKNGFPLAISTVSYDLYALKDYSKTKHKLLRDKLGLEIDFPSSGFDKKTLIKKNLDINQINSIKSLKHNKLEIERRYVRHYPLGEQIAPLIGFSGKDGIGQEGVEFIYDNSLSGKEGNEKYYKNAKQEIISKPIVLNIPEDGQDIYLTIDATIQFYAYKYLVESIKNNNAKGGSVVILNNKTSEVLAVASYPSYNPNSANRKIQRNRVFLDSYEPGSVLKPITISEAIHQGIYEIDTYLELPQKILINGKQISDIKKYEELSIAEIISNSSQVGASKIALDLGFDNIAKTYKKFGFSKPQSIGFPSESFGYINMRENISDHEIASLGFGYGITANPFQIAVAYSVFANEGMLHNFNLIKNDDLQFEPIRVISSDAAQAILNALNQVIEDGTGKLAKTKYKSGGKTGTAHKIRGNGYAKDLYISSFVGITPIDEKLLTIFVNIDEPDLNAYSGGDVAAPLFSKIAQNSLEYLEVSNEE
ncbi:MAG: penicillin-binding protein 2 [Gammaproteobacteria bacterium]|jgi:cell division protein FtsI (penicillin-binding protein 3)|uniref:Peptidoglycan ligase FtsI n=1 Tax=SAR86 cluster bacterium SAR86B TaxID=1123867 RepID=J5KQ64_9GAMM|nr:MAG: peptidoglycan ligase FtsI [SAR86 cluster bacterium SAR86B]|tara:strand:+ start:4350 stop:5969 length:1620 start_codon:yes stop_codon:yes gene_type:complete